MCPDLEPSSETSPGAEIGFSSLNTMASPLELENVDALTDLTWNIRAKLKADGITGDQWCGD